MKQLTPAERDAIYRSDFLAFAQAAFFELEPDNKFEPSWHHEAIAQVLVRNRRKENSEIHQRPAAIAEIFFGVGRIGRF